MFDINVLDSFDQLDFWFDIDYIGENVHPEFHCMEPNYDYQ